MADLSLSVPPALDALIAELLQKDPAARPSDAETVRRRIAAIGDASRAEDPTIPLGAPEDLTGTREYPSLIPAPPQPRRRRGVRAALAGIILAGAVGVAIALLAAGSPPHRPSTTTSTSTSRATSTSTSTSSSTTTILPRATTPAQAIAQLQSAIAKAESTGQLAPPAGTDLSNRLSDLTTTLASGNVKNAGHQVADLASQVQDLVRSGEITRTGQAILAGPLAALERLVPPQGGPGGPAHGK